LKINTNTVLVNKATAAPAMT